MSSQIVLRTALALQNSFNNFTTVFLSNQPDILRPNQRTEGHMRPAPYPYLTLHGYSSEMSFINRYMMAVG